MIVLVIKVREVKIVEEMKRSDGLTRFACGNIFGFHPEVLNFSPKCIRFSENFRH